MPNAHDSMAPPTSFSCELFFFELVWYVYKQVSGRPVYNGLDSNMLYVLLSLFSGSKDVGPSSVKPSVGNGRPGVGKMNSFRTRGFLLRMSSTVAAS